MVKSDLKTSFSTTEIFLKGNQLLSLDTANTFWFVRSGSVGVFAVTAGSDRRIQGARQHLFTVKSGEALFGTAFVTELASENLLGIVAVAMVATQLQAISLQDLVGKIKQKEHRAIAILEGWLKHLNRWLSEQETIAKNIVTAKKNDLLTLTKSQTLQPATDEIIWVTVNHGSTRLFDCEPFPLTAKSPPFPLTSSMGLNIVSQKVQVATVSTARLEQPEQLPHSLALLHRYFLLYFSQTQQRKMALEYERFQQRNQLNLQVAESAFGSLANVLDTKVTKAKAADTKILESGNALLIAAGAVGRARNIEVKPPLDAEDLNRVKDPLEAIARASLFRTRRVTLTGKWWLEEHGALMGYRLQDRSPIALLPNQNNWLNRGANYSLFAPESGQKQKIDEVTAEEISPEAYIFYRPLPLAMSHPIEVFRFGVRGYQPELVAVVILGIIGSLLGMVTPQATAMLIDNAIPNGDRLILWQIGLALLAAAFGKALFQLAQSMVSLRVENAADGNLQLAVWDRLLQLSPGFFRQYSSGDLLTRSMAISQVRQQLSGATQRTLLSAIFALLNLVLMFVYSAKLAMIGVGITILTIVVTAISSKLLIKKQRQQEKLDGKISSLTVELIGGVSKLKVAAAESRAFASWAKQYSQQLKLSSSVQKINDAVETFTEALPEVSSMLLFGFAIFFIQTAAKNEPLSFNAGTFLAFNSAFGIFLNGAVDLSNTLTDILEIVPLWERGQPILQSEPESNADKASPGRLTGHLSLDRVNFRYRQEGALTLENISLRIQPGEFVAFVGSSGSGKSTLFRLLLGFETPLSGTVYYDGQDLAGLNVPAVRRQLGVVLQNVRISQGSIFESISCGALISLDEAWSAAQMAGFAQDIEQMPMGMHTVVSEGGSNLSGGQRQRLLIARALVLQPKIILMDEATSALDNRTQEIVTQSLEQIDATKIVIAHRLSTIRNADRIYVLEAGRIVQAGKYSQLINRDGVFARLVARQLD